MAEAVRILHVVGGMRRAGTETWLMHVLRNIDRSRFRMDFLTHTTEPAHYDAEVRSLGGRIIPCLSTSNPALYARNFHRVLREFGSYDVVECHLHHFCGIVMWLARREGVRVRVAHSHLGAERTETRAGIGRRLYERTAVDLVRRHATHGLAASEVAAQALFGPEWRRDRRWQVMHCSIDLRPFEKRPDRNSVRTELRLPQDALVIGHVGRFEPGKNHAFAVDVLAAASRMNPSVWGLLVGDGALRPEVEKRAADLGIGERVVFAGVRDDIPRLTLGAMDGFVFPSRFEGLGIVLIEAQAAGLPCVVSEGIPAEAVVVPELVQRLSLSDGPEVWASVMLEARARISRDEALARVRETDFNIELGMRELCDFYTGAVSSAGFAAAVVGAGDGSVV